ncbi:MAG: dihydrolipoyl dehydrogenase, partial [Firmicutes bacterium]|nr:dihydrolipoyl dehydrogenase [Bacillota bacterium]
RAAYKERVVPSCVYMFPEFAGVGKTEEQLKEKGTDYQTGRFPLVANGKSVIMEEPDGVVKILSDARSGHILGGHILGPRATDLIGEIAMAMQMHGKVEDIIGLIHPHPTVAEAIHEAALASEDRAIHFK